MCREAGTQHPTLWLSPTPGLCSLLIEPGNPVTAFYVDSRVRDSVLSSAHSAVFHHADNQLILSQPLLKYSQCTCQTKERRAGPALPSSQAGPGAGWCAQGHSAGIVRGLRDQQGECGSDVNQVEMQRKSFRERAEPVHRPVRNVPNATPPQPGKVRVQGPQESLL